MSVIILLLKHFSNKNKELLRIKGKIVETKNITEMTIVKEEWATVLTAAIFIF